MSDHEELSLENLYFPTDVDRVEQDWGGYLCRNDRSRCVAVTFVPSFKRYVPTIFICTEREKRIERTMNRFFVWVLVPMALLLVYAKYVDFELRRVALYGNFCGPASDFSKTPKDGVDELCRIHDACIEEDLKHVDYIPLRTHRVPEFGCTIMRCDVVFIRAAKTLSDDQLCGAWKENTIRRSYCRFWAWLGQKYHEMKGTDILFIYLLLCKISLVLFSFKQ